MCKVILLKDIIRYLGSQVRIIYGNPETIEIRYLRNPLNVDEFTLDWINPRRSNKQSIVETSLAKAILVDETIQYSESLKAQGKVIIVVDNPKIAISKVGTNFFIDKIQCGIHHSAVVHIDSEIGNNVFIGANAYIGKCWIGDNVVIRENVTLYNNVIIKNNVIIHAGTVIGVDGLGCEREKDNTLVKFPHFGKVIIEDDVEIGANCIITKGALSDTIIGKGTKINGGSYIAHNVIIGENVWISIKANIAGSAKVGNNATIFNGAIIRDNKLIGNGATIGMGSVVTKDVPNGEIWVGNPAKKLKK